MVHDLQRHSAAKPAADKSEELTLRISKRTGKTIQHRWLKNSQLSATHVRAADHLSLDWISFSSKTFVATLSPKSTATVSPTFSLQTYTMLSLRSLNRLAQRTAPRIASRQLSIAARRPLLSTPSWRAPLQPRGRLAAPFSSTISRPQGKKKRKLLLETYRAFLSHLYSTRRAHRKTGF